MKVSIITVCLNSQDTIEETINSVNKQNYDDIEHIFIDGGSTDKTIDLIKTNAKNFTILLKEPTGIYPAMNEGIRKSSGDVISFLNADDVFSNDFVIKNATSYLLKQNKDVVYSSVKFLNKSKKVVRVIKDTKFRPYMFSIGLMPPQPGAFFSKSAIESCGFFDESFKLAGDFDYFIRLYKELGHSKIDYYGCWSVLMKVGGASNRNFKSNIRNTEEMYSSLKKNNFFASRVILWFRLVIKIFSLRF